MNLVRKVALSLAFIASFASCKFKSDSEEVLSKPESRKEIMETIVNSNAMMEEMTVAILNNNNAKMVMQKNEKVIVMMLENRDTIMKVMKNNPVMMQNMMSDMMESCKNDSSMMSDMCKKMMENQPMMDMMHQMNGEKMDMKKMEGMNHKM
ncbi:MAG: hypothetical protein H7246_22170 [Phycisphaerae bacterium]|nr:hypothetical protein [Saprospiraceae bacterium]